MVFKVSYREVILFVSKMLYVLKWRMKMINVNKCYVEWWYKWIIDVEMIYRLWFKMLYLFFCMNFMKLFGNISDVSFICIFLYYYNLIE